MAIEFWTLKNAILIKKISNMSFRFLCFPMLVWKGFAHICSQSIHYKKIPQITALLWQAQWWYISSTVLLCVVHLLVLLSVSLSISPCTNQFPSVAGELLVPCHCAWKRVSDNPVLQPSWHFSTIITQIIPNPIQNFWECSPWEYPLFLYTFTHRLT